MRFSALLQQDAAISTVVKSAWTKRSSNRCRVCSSLRRLGAFHHIHQSKPRKARRQDQRCEPCLAKQSCHLGLMPPPPPELLRHSGQLQNLPPILYFSITSPKPYIILRAHCSSKEYVSLLRFRQVDCWFVISPPLCMPPKLQSYIPKPLSP